MFKSNRKSNSRVSDQIFTPANESPKWFKSRPHFAAFSPHFFYSQSHQVRDCRGRKKITSRSATCMGQQLLSGVIITNDGTAAAHIIGRLTHADQMSRQWVFSVLWKIDRCDSSRPGRRLRKPRWRFGIVRNTTFLQRCFACVFVCFSVFLSCVFFAFLFITVLVLFSCMSF